MVAGVSASNENKFADLFATVAASSDGLKDQVKKLGDELTIMKGVVASNMFSSARQGHSEAVPNKVDKGKQKITKCGAVQVLVGDIICGIKPGVGESLELDSVHDGFLVGSKSTSPRVGDTAGA
ncbi:hypothetical protein ACET3Z_012560 [Daucus carota]